MHSIELILKFISTRLTYLENCRLKLKKNHLKKYLNQKCFFLIFLIWWHRLNNNLDSFKKILSAKDVWRLEWVTTDEVKNVLGFSKLVKSDQCDHTVEVFIMEGCYSMMKLSVIIEAKNTFKAVGDLHR